jgi:hypothetical protein
VVRLVAVLFELVLAASPFGMAPAQGTPAPAATPAMPSYLAGNAYDLIPQGEDGKLAVVGVGPVWYTQMPVVIRNNTDRLMKNIKVTATARDVVTSSSSH